MRTFSKITFSFLIGICLFVSTNAFAQTISPYLIGNNAWYDGSLANLWDDMALAKFQTIRIGGAGAEGYGTTSTKYLTLIDGIRSANCEPIVQVPRYFTEAEVVAFITKINITNAKNVKIWSIGNEPDHSNRPSTVEEVSAYIKRISSALKSVDPTIKVMGPETAGFQSTNYVSRLLGGDLDISGADAKGNFYIDVYTWHRYMFTNASGLEADVNTFLTKVNAVNANRPTDKKISWGITEFNTSYNNDDNTLGEDQNVWSFRAGQTFAEIYGLGMRKGAFTMTAWSMLEGEIERMGTDLSLFDKDLKGRSNYYHSLMLGQNMKKNYVTPTDNQTNIVVIPMKDETGVAVMILNTDKVNGFDYSLKLNTTAVSQSNTLNININAGLDKEIQGYIPSAATQMLVFDAAGNLIKRYIYTANDANARRGPVIQTTLCNTPPAINLIPKQTKPNDKGVFLVNLSGITDADKCIQGVTVTATSSNANIVAVNAVNYTSCNKTGTLDLLPKADGLVTITVSVTEMLHSCTPMTTTTSFLVNSYNPVLIPGKLEAENYIDMYGVKTETTTDAGLGQNVGYVDAKDWMDYGVRIAKAGTYDVNFRLASNPTATTGVFKLMNGSTTLATVTATKTGGWQIWNTQTARVNLPTGDQILRIAVTGSGVNINWIEFVDPFTAVSDVNATQNNFRIYSTRNAVNFDFTDLENLNAFQFKIYNLSGQTIYSTTLQPTFFKLTLGKNILKQGIYISSIQSQGITVRKIFIMN